MSVRAHTGGIVWFTGLSGAGKSTLASAVAAELAERRPTELLDGDEVRMFVSAGLGFTRADRDTNVQRIAYIARLLAKHGVLALVSAISPYAETRAAVKQLSGDAGHPFVEVFVDAPLAVVEARDVKGLYARARAGQLPAFTGISDPYEAPPTPDIHVHTDRHALAACVEQVTAELTRRALI